VSSLCWDFTYPIQCVHPDCLVYFCQEETRESRDVNVDEEDDDDVVVGGCFFLDHVTGCRSAMVSLYNRRKSHIKRGVLAVLVALYAAYFTYALYYKFGDEGSIRLLWVTCLVVAILVLSLIKSCLRPRLQRMSSSKSIDFFRQHHGHIKWFDVSFSHEAAE